jgi:hypothetical protein
MKSLVSRVVMLAASAMVLGTMAYGQTEMKAQIPFAFHTTSGSFSAGEYTIGQQSMNSGIAVATLRDQESGHKVFVSGGIKDLWKGGSPAAVFRCSDEKGCVLTAIRTPAASILYSTGESGRSKEAAMVVVPLRAVNAD